MNTVTPPVAAGPEQSSPIAGSWSLIAIERVLLGVVALAALAVFSKTVGAGFVAWDDDTNIYNNPHLKLGLSVEGFRWMFSDLQYVPRYMPLGWLSLAVNYQIDGLNPVGFHLGNLLFHAVNSGLVFLLLHRLLSISRPSFNAGVKPVKLLWCSAFGALVWAIHPLRVEAVAWASARIYQQAVFFLLISCLAYLQAHGQTGSLRRQRMLLWISVIAFTCSLLTYPVALGYPLVLVVLDVWVLKRLQRQLCEQDGPPHPSPLIGHWKLDIELRKVLLEKIPFLAAGGFVLALTLAARAHAPGMAGPLSLDAFPLSERVMQAFYMLGYYLWKPWLPMNLSPLYSTLISFNPWAAPFLLSASFVLGITSALWLRRRSGPGLLALWLCYVAVLFPVLGLTEHPHFPSDRYSFIPGILWSVVISAALLKLSPRFERRGSALLAGAAGLALLAVASIRQCNIWQDDAHLLPCMIASVENHPARAKPELIYGVLLMRQGRVAQAEQSFRNAIRFQPQSALAHANLADALCEENKPIEAIAFYHRALALEPGDLHAREGLAVALGTTHHFEEAAVQFRAVLRADPHHAAALHNLAATLQQLGQKEPTTKF